MNSNLFKRKRILIPLFVFEPTTYSDCVVVFCGTKISIEIYWKQQLMMFANGNTS